MSIIAVADPFRRESGLEVILKLVTAFRAPLECPALITVYDLLVGMAEEPAKMEECSPPIHVTGSQGQRPYGGS